MTENDSDPPDRPRVDFSHLDALHLVDIERRLTEGDYVDPEELAANLRKHGQRPIPSHTLEYLCRHLEGKVPAPKGRRALPELEKHRQSMILRHVYQRTLAWLRQRKQRYGHLDGWPYIRNADWWQGPPHERAARMAAKRFRYGAEAWRSLLNEVSSRK
ncbi:hypothetical protein [Pelagibius sp.]|uniref:hypothetical protein n=1 Tax=Pelagibius sp. TaxID=1931238 RepID=UPI003B509B12